MKQPGSVGRDTLGCLKVGLKPRIMLESWAKSLPCQKKACSMLLRLAGVHCCCCRDHVTAQITGFLGIRPCTPTAHGPLFVMEVENA